VNVHAPNSIQGLQVRVESVCSTLLQARGDRAVDRLTLLSVRQADNLLVATLEVAHFSAQAPLGDPSFRTGVFDNIGDTLPQGLTVGRETVYTSTSPGLDLASWIRGSYLYVLAVRDSYAYPKALLRVALQVSA
jgi:hypothetical protein